MPDSRVSFLVLGILVGSVLAYSYFQISNLTTEIREVKATAQRDIQSVQNLVSDLNKKNDEVAGALQAKNDELTKRLQALNDVLSSKAQQISGLNQTIAQLRIDKAKLENDLAVLRANITNLEKVKSDLQRLDGTLSAQIRLLLEQISTLQQTVRSLQTENVNLQNQIGLLVKQISNLNATINVLKTQINATKQIPVPSSSFGKPYALFRGSPAPVGVAVDALGTVYWANWDSGQLLSMPKGASSPIVLLSGLDHPSGIDVDRSGNVYYTEYLLKTVSILPAGSKTPSLLFRAQNYPPFISLDDAGNVYYIEGETCNGRGSNKIVKYDGTLKTLTTILNGQGANPWFGSIHIHRSGGLYYTACGSGTVERLPRGSSTPEVLVRSLNWPNGIRADIDGNVFYTEYSRGVSMLAKGATTPVTIATEGGTHYELALDDDGNLYYSDNMGGTIWKVPRLSQPAPQPAPVPSGTVYVTIKDQEFQGGTMTVKKGTKVIFKHMDTSLGGGDPGIHNVVAKNGKFKSPDMGFGQSWEIVFNEVGVFEYFCEPHPFMTGKITVVEG